MIFLDPKELYSMFLDSDWWISLSRRKRSLVGRCERCSSTDRLQSHHLLYRDNWFDTLLEDLEVLCRPCHEKEHGIGQDKPVLFLGTRKALEYARSKRKISRQEFLVARQKMLDAGMWGGKAQKRSSNVPSRIPKKRARSPKKWSRAMERARRQQWLRKRANWSF